MYFRCPNCGTSFAKRYVEWFNETEKLEANKKLSEDEKNKKVRKLLDKLGLDNICCVPRFITSVNPTKLIK